MPHDTITEVISSAIPASATAPRRLLPQHRDHLKTSGLSDATLDKLEGHVLYSVTDESDARRLLRIPEGQPTPPLPALAIEYPLTGGYTRLRPDVPRLRGGPDVADWKATHDHDWANPLSIGEEAGKPIKYEAPRDLPSRIFIPADLHADIGNPDADLWLVEGEKKALAACEAGLPAVAASGVWNWNDVTARREGKVAGADVLLPHRDFAQLHLKARRCIILFDSDIDTNVKVLKAAVRLGQMLLRAGADAQMGYVPHDGKTKVGLDDFYAREKGNKDPLGDIEASVRPFHPGELLDWLEEQWGDWSSQVQRRELKRAVQLAQLVFAKDATAFVGWCKDTQRVLKVKANDVAALKLPKEEEPKPDARDWVEAWAKKNEVTYSYGTQCFTLRGKPTNILDLFRTLALDTTQAEVGLSRQSLDDAFNLWVTKQDEVALAACRQKIAFEAGNTGQRALEAFVQAVTGRVDPVDVAVLQHFVWQVKRKLLGLKVQHHLMPILVGPQGAGKSEALKKFLGPVLELSDFAADLTMLADERQLARLARSHIIFFDEMAKAARVDVESLKNRVSADTVRWRALGTNKTMAAPNAATFIGAANEDVQDLIADPTGARRFYQLQSAPQMDWMGINTLDALALWKGVDPSAPSPLLAPHIMAELKKRQAALRVADAVEQWLDERCIVGGEAWTPPAPCFESFVAYLKARNIKALWSKTKFCRRLGALVETKASNGTKYNLRLVGDGERALQLGLAAQTVTHASNPSTKAPAAHPGFPQ